MHGLAAPIPLNEHIGRRVRTRRKELGMRLASVADVVGISLQALFKYETGETRIPAAALWPLSQALEVPVGYFFDEAQARGHHAHDA